MRCKSAPKGWYWCWLDDSWHHEKIIIKKTMALFCTDEPPDEFCSFAVLRADNEVAELHHKLHDWCVNHVKLDWMTGLSAIEGTEAVIAGALENGNLSDLSSGPPTLHSLPGKYPEEGDEPRQDGERVETKCLGEVSYNKSMELLGEELPVTGKAATKRKDNIPL